MHDFDISLPPPGFYFFFIVSSVNNLFGGGKINKAGKSDFESGVVKSGKIRSTKACRFWDKRNLDVKSKMLLYQVMKRL